MSRRRIFASFLVVVSLFSISLSSYAAPPALVSAASRISHSGLPYDSALPLIGNSGIECRVANNGTMSIVFNFDTPVTGGTATRTAGTGVLNGVSFSNNSMIVNLTGVTNQQELTITVSDVTNGTETLPSAAVTVRILYGDVNASGAVTVADVNLTKSRVGQAVQFGNYRSDIDRSGTITGTTTSDLSIVKSQINRTVAGGAAANSLPTISDITDQTTPLNTSLADLPLTIGDAETPGTALHISATSSNTALVPSANITFGGSGTSRTLTVAPVADQVGTTTITVTVSDGLGLTVDTFLLQVGSPTKLYVAYLRPPTNPQVISNASGFATLLVNEAQTQATFRVYHFNLATNKTGIHVRGPDNPGVNVMFDVDAATVEADGTYVWVFTQTGNTTVEDIKNAIAGQQAFVNISTNGYPDGELRGTFKYQTGSSTFTPPPAPPALPPGPPTDFDAQRFLTQATFGPTSDEITRLKNMGFDDWLTEQFNTPTTSLLDLLKARWANSNPTTTTDSSSLTDAWWYLAMQGNDQLRQRVAMAYSEIFVVSRVEDAISGQIPGVAHYHDMLAGHAFGNFRNLLKDVTLHPVMGQYLNMRGNRKPVSPSFIPPNENYAREVLQLFSIGLNHLHPDGTLRLGANGLPMPTYDQEVVENFSHVFTGWNTDSNPVIIPYWDGDSLENMNSFYIRPMVVSASNHSNDKKTLLGWPGQAPLVIPALATHTAATANNALEITLENIFNHPNVGPFMSRLLIQRLVTVNPSPGYIYRVAQKFDDNGSGVRGDMKAVVKAILTDYEARSTAMLGNQGYGKLREPLLRFSAVLRAFHPFSSTNPPFWRVSSTDTELAQTIYRSPTVFNFFEPDYVTAVKIPVSGGSQVLDIAFINPEMQSTTENNAIYMANMYFKGVLGSGAGGTGGTSFSINSMSSDIRIDLTSEQNIAGNATTLVDHLNLLLMGGTMPQNMRNEVINHVNTIAVTGTATQQTAARLKRARAAAYLVTASPQFTVQK